MKLSSQEEYGLRCLLSLARQGQGGSLTLAEMSQSEGISVANVGKMMRVLRRAGFVKSTRGVDGGYTLSRPAEQINVGELLAALGGRLYDSHFCERHAGSERLCTHLSDCSIRSVWQRIQRAVDQVVETLTLKDLTSTEHQLSGSWQSSRGVMLSAIPLEGRRP